jgi:hypothetical protein
MRANHTETRPKNVLVNFTPQGSFGNRLAYMSMGCERSIFEKGAGYAHIWRRRIPYNPTLVRAPMNCCIIRYDSGFGRDTHQGTCTVWKGEREEKGQRRTYTLSMVSPLYVSGDIGDELRGDTGSGSP